MNFQTYEKSTQYHMYYAYAELLKLIEIGLSTQIG